MQKQILTAHDLSIGINDELISNIDFGVSLGDRIGIIGNNGSGKTTLLKTIAKLTEPYGGSFSLNGTCYYVPQVHSSKNWGGLTVGAYSISSSIQADLVTRFLVENFSLELKKENLMSQLSGGQQSLVIFACEFLKSPDLLLLDEPTNHLDVDAKQVLINLIKNFKGAVICVSHDAWFLEQITNHLWIVQDGEIRVFTGSYGEYKKEQALNEGARERKLEVALKEKRKLEVVRKREDVRQARSKKEGKKQKLDRSMSRMEVGTMKMKAETVGGKNKKRLDEANEIISEKIGSLSSTKKKKVSGSIVTTENRGSLIRISDAKLSVQGKQILDHVSFDMQKGDRVAVMGKNGSGKSALMKAILGQSDYLLEPKPYKNPSLRFEYLDQHYSIIDLNKSVLDNAVEFSGEQVERVRQHLSHFLFGDSLEVLKKAKDLSGGMLARLAFVMLTIAPIDLLILDEPTNNLDMETIEAIKDLLLEYKGGLIVISHDLAFIERLNIQKFYSVDKTLKQVSL